jgi:hypothetical protein
MLVVAGMASGFLWRAALEPSGPDEVLRAIPRPPTPRVVTVEVPVSARPGQQPRRRAGEATPTRQLVRQPSSSAGVPRSGSRGTSTTPRPSRPEGTPAPSPAPKPSPAPQPSPTPQPTPSPSPPATTPPSQSGAASNQSGPVQQPAQTQTRPPTTTTSVRPGATQHPAGSTTRPGWGHGDDNHPHSGPAGLDDSAKEKDKGKGP